MRRIVAASLSLAAMLPLVSPLVAPLGAQPACDMPVAFDQADRDAPDGKTRVHRSDTPERALFFAEHLNVNTDGTPRSYAIDDVFGRTRALNNMCNAMTDVCRGLGSAGRAQRAADVKAAADAGWPPAALARTRLSSAVIVMRGGKPCPARDGFLLSATALENPAVADRCDAARYVDALTVPALVLPLGSAGFRAAGARVGDLVVAMAPGGAPVFGVVGDAGPANALGEASIAMNGRLNGLTRDPENYRDVLRHWVTGRVGVLIFPGSRDAGRPFMDNDRIAAAATPLFARWGGADRLRACLAR